MNYFDDVKLIKSRDGKLVSEDISSGSFDFIKAKETEYRSESYGSSDDEKLPEDIRTLRAFMRSNKRSGMSRTRAFFEEAKLMEKYEDNYEGSGRIYKSYRIVYEDLDNAALRSYFSFRTNFRHGNYQKPDDENFVYILIMELLMQIGVDNAEEGLKKLYELSVNYQYNAWVYGYELTKWMQDYVVYYGMPNKYVRYVFKKEIKADWSIYVLENTGKFSDEDIFKAVKLLSDYGIEDKPLSRKFPEDTLHATAAVFRELDKGSFRRYKRSLMALMGYCRMRENYQMFRDAVFYFNDSPESGIFKVDTARIFRKNKRSWKCESYGIDIGLFLPTDEMNSIVREIDRLLRKYLGFKKTLKERPVFIDYQEDILLAIQKYLRDKEEAKKPVIKVDMSKLSNIRSDADYTRESLLEGVEEEFDFVEAETEENDGTADVDILDKSEAAEDILETGNVLPAGLTEDEAGLIGIMLEAGSASGYARDRHLILSVLVDSINEKMYDIFSDTLIDMSGDEPEIIEDYIEEIRDLFMNMS